MSLERVDYPKQVSTEQESQDRSEIACSNGASFSTLNLESFYAHHGRLTNANSAHIDENNVISQYTRNNISTPSNFYRPAKPARYPEHSEYSQRLKTYARWTRQRPYSIRLTEAGFFFTNQADLVRCYQCGIGLKDFSWDDDPLLEHVRHSEDCQYLLEYLGKERLSAIKAKCQTKGLNTSNGSLHGQVNNQISTSLRIRHPQYQTLPARISSYNGWPGHILQKPEELAEAGLFFTGMEDHVRCFTCDGGLRSWDPEDAPWTEHCRWFPNCPFAREKMGDEFIALVQSSAAFNQVENETPANEHVSEDLSVAMQQLSLEDPEIRAALMEHKETCLEMGFKEDEFNEAVQELRNRGNSKPTIEDILDAIDLLIDNNQTSNPLESKPNETPLEENIRLKRMIMCMTCGKNDVNALFLPCTHHRMCMECAESFTHCPVCEKYIRQKIKTYLA